MVTPEEKQRKSQQPCPWGPNCFKLDKDKYPGGCDYKHTAAEYAAAKAKGGGGGGGAQKSKGPGASPKDKGAGKGHLVCRVCKNKLGDKAAHPNGQFCQKPAETPGPKASRI